MKFLCQHSPPNLYGKQSSIRRRFNHNLTANLPLLDDYQHGVPLKPPDSPPPHRHSPKEMALAVSNSFDLKRLRQVFAHIIRTHFLQLYPHSFHYNNISRSYIRLHSPREASHVYIAMNRAGISPDKFTLPIILKAANQMMDRALAKQAHGVSVKYGIESNVYCESGLISMYSKMCEFRNARKVFDKSTERKLGSWNAIIGGLSQGGRGREALHMFVQMMQAGLRPDDVTMVCATSACGAIGDLNLALQLHKCVIQATCLAKSDILMMNSVIDMYGKCGRMDMAYKIFSTMEDKNVSSWTSMIVGYAAHGHVDDALTFFGWMREAGVSPNHVTFVGVLTACVHGGMVREGKDYFKMMKDVYGVEPMMAHYGCMVDLLGRAGLLDEAMTMVEEMPMKANVVIWGCLMGACEKHGDVRMGEFVAKQLVEIEPTNDGPYVVLSNIYASRGMWKEVESLRRVMKERMLPKLPAYSLPAG